MNANSTKRGALRSDCEVCGGATDALYRTTTGFYVCPACRAFGPEADTSEIPAPGLGVPSAVECARTVFEKVEAVLQIVGQLSDDTPRSRDMRRLRDKLEQCRSVLLPLIPTAKSQ